MLSLFDFFHDTYDSFYFHSGSVSGEGTVLQLFVLLGGLGDFGLKLWMNDILHGTRHDASQINQQSFVMNLYLAGSITQGTLLLKFR